MIDVDKMRAAYATQPLCQKEWTRKEGNNPTMLCAVSALISFAGVQPDLIHKMNTVLGATRWVDDFAAPVLEAEYGLPYSVMNNIPSLFDAEENEYRGVQEVLALCETRNMDERYGEAIVEDRQRFPQFGPATRDHASFGIRFVHFSSQLLSWNWLGATTQTKKVAKAPVDVLAYSPLILAESTDFLTSGEKALDEYYKLSGNSPLLWSSAVMPVIAKKFAMPSFVDTL